MSALGIFKRYRPIPASFQPCCYLMLTRICYNGLVHGKRASISARDRRESDRE